MIAGLNVSEGLSGEFEFMTVPQLENRFTCTSAGVPVVGKAGNSQCNAAYDDGFVLNFTAFVMEKLNQRDIGRLTSLSEVCCDSKQPSM